MNISHFRFILFNLKIFSEIVTTYKNIHTCTFQVAYFPGFSGQTVSRPRIGTEKGHGIEDTIFPAYGW